MTELLIKIFLKGRESTCRCCIHMHAQGSVWVKERHTHTRLNRVIFVHSARKSDQVKMQEES